MSAALRSNLLLVVLGAVVVVVIISNVYVVHQQDALLAASKTLQSVSQMPDKAKPFQSLTATQSEKLEDLQSDNDSLEEKVRELQNQIQALQRQLSKCRRQGLSSPNDEVDSQLPCKSQEERASGASWGLLPAQSTKSLKNRSPMCSVLPNVFPSTLHVWNSFLDRIVRASIHENDVNIKMYDFTAGLLHLVSPERMDRSVVGLPRDWSIVKRVLEKTWLRYQHVIQKDDNKSENGDDTNSPPGPEKVKILVMGGSLIVGVNCRRVVKDQGLGFLMPNRLCTWTHRLETFLNRMIGADVFEVIKVALGGTNTETGHVLLEQDFLPPEAKNPDILINAYSTNDMHILTVMEARRGNQTLRDKVMEMTQNFVRAAMKEGSCAPLLMHMDDYLGNEQREILTTMELSQAVQTLSAYYGFSAMSYANVVRDIVYGDTREEWISPKGWYNESTGEMTREIHPGMGMHILTSWVAAYNMLNLALTFCSTEEFWRETVPVDETLTVPYEVITGLPQPKKRAKILGKPHGRPRGLPPPLNASLSLENVTALWKEAKPLPRMQADECRRSNGPKCSFSWISGLTKAGLNRTLATNLFVTSATKNTGWVINDDGGKMGVSPDPDRAALSVSRGDEVVLGLDFLDLSHEITTVTMFYMKSYGEKWANSRIRLSGSWQKEGSGSYELLQSHELVGFHGKNTSETYTHHMYLTGIESGNNFRLEIQLIGGTTFKIMGLAVCK